MLAAEIGDVIQERENAVRSNNLGPAASKSEITVKGSDPYSRESTVQGVSDACGHRVSDAVKTVIRGILRVVVGFKELGIPQHAVRDAVRRAEETAANARSLGRPIAVEGKSQRRGVARKLFSSLAEELGRSGVAEIILEVRAGNEPAQGLYRSLGFVEEGRRRGYYADPVEDAVLMRLRLKTVGSGGVL